MNSTEVFKKKMLERLKGLFILKKKSFCCRSSENNYLPAISCLCQSTVTVIIPAKILGAF